MPQPTRSNDPLLDLPEDDSVTGEHLDTQVQKAQEQLVALKRQQEYIEKQKRELEELSRRQEQLHQGRAEMLEKFTRALVVVARETYDAQKRVEQLHTIRESFLQHQQVLEGINPKAWEGLDMNKELSKALSAIDDARAEYAKTLPKIKPESNTESGDPAAESAGFNLDYHAPGLSDRDFLFWLKAGTAFTLPLLLLGLVYVVVLLLNQPR
ncbi:MAG: hypothetical protein M3463_09425 [Verrucomicrobiota bacterium]|nr:hypothetical protein [Verrucomicrobiota bacterium]